MSERILVEIKCPSVSRKYDFSLLSDMTVEECIKIIRDDIAAFEGIIDVFNKFDRVCLYNSNGNILKNSFTLAECFVKSGDTLLLI